MERISLNPESLRRSDNSESKCSPEVVAKSGQMLFSAYRRDDFADAAGFAVQIASVLSEFSEEVVLYVTSPKTGLQRRSKWPPTISEVLTACEQHQDYLAKARARRPTIEQRLPSPSLRNRPQGALANIFVPESNPRYARLLEWTKEADPVFWKHGTSSAGELGLHIPLNIWQEGVPAPASTKHAPPQDLTLTPEARAAMAQRYDPLPSNEREDHQR